MVAHLRTDQGAYAAFRLPMIKGVQPWGNRRAGQRQGTAKAGRSYRAEAYFLVSPVAARCNFTSTFSSRLS